MDSTRLDTSELEKLIRQKFEPSLKIDSVIAERLPVSRNARAFMFLSAKKQLYVFIVAEPGVTLGNIKKIISRMGLKASEYVAPVSRPDYFDDVARQQFIKIFPGRRHISPDDLTYYRTLVPYNPALVQISDIPDGVIKQFDPDSHGGWRPAVKFSYRRIQTS